jgi:hypothetical protein
MRRVLLSLAALLLSATSAAAAPPDWSGLNWLLGRWTGVGGGTEQGQGGFSFLPEAGGSVIVRRNVADYTAQNGRPASRHEDLMVIYREGAAMKATYWDSEGQTIHYVASTPSPGEIVFLSEDPAGPRFRLSYRKTASGLVGRFEIAPPPARDQFKDYLTWTATPAAR